RVTYVAHRIDLSRFEIASGPSHLALSATFDHPAGDFATGNAHFRIEPSSIDLARVHSVQQMRPGLAGLVQLSADGSFTMVPASPHMPLPKLNANLAAAKLAANGNRLGDLNLAAHTPSDNRLDFTLQSDLAGSTIQARGNGQLGGDYPLNAQ